jgi:5-methyltetrahydropteroyltriglutamate--homocysteine methyltransferase
MADKKITRPFRADQVGSYLRPDELMLAREAHEKGKVSDQELHALEDKLIVELVKRQEDCGMPVVTDGEFRRSSWNKDFLGGFDNVVEQPGNLKLYHRNPDGTNTTNQITGWGVTGKLKRSRPIQVDSFNFLKKITKVTPKTCITSPTLLHFRGGREAIDKKTYPEMSQFFDDVAAAYREEIKDLYAAGCRYLQLDDTNFAYLCDTRFRDAVKEMGEDPTKLVDTYVKLVNDSVRDKPADMLVGIHLCRGNSSTAGAATGGYDVVGPQMFPKLNVDAFFLEYDDARAGGFEALKDVPKGKTVVLGLITTKRAELEKKDDLKRRIDQAAKFVPMENLCLSPQCGFSSGAHMRKRISIDDEFAKVKLLTETAKEVWGGM